LKLGETISLNMKKDHMAVIRELISGISMEAWKSELDLAASKYHITVLWVAIIFDPIFAITDYLNIPLYWKLILGIRLMVSFVTLLMIVSRKFLALPSYLMVVITFFMISLQNAFIYKFIDNANFLGQNLNYMALMIGASMFLIWPLAYSVIVVVVSTIATFYFIRTNPQLDVNQFFLNGGLLLGASAIFMMIQIRTRYDLTVKEIKARLALKASNEEIQAQAEEIRGINDNLELLVRQRTLELEKKNKALEEYAFINAHKLRAPVASILGLVNLITKQPLNQEIRDITEHLKDSTQKLDAIVSSITKAIEKGERI
jgi:signal transduction histidine kinase